MQDWRQAIFDMIFMAAAFLLLVYITLHYVKVE